MGNEAAMAVIDSCRIQLKELGIEDILIGVFDNSDGGAAYTYAGNPKTLAFMANSLLLEVMFESIAAPDIPEVKRRDD